MLLLPDRSQDPGLKLVGDWGRDVSGACWGTTVTVSWCEGHVGLCSWASYSEPRPWCGQTRWVVSRPPGRRRWSSASRGQGPHGPWAAAPGRQQVRMGVLPGLRSHAVLLDLRKVSPSVQTDCLLRPFCLQGVVEELDVLYKPGGRGAAVAGSGLSPPCQAPVRVPWLRLSLGPLAQGCGVGFSWTPGAVLPHRNP